MFYVAQASLQFTITEDDPEDLTLLPLPPKGQDDRLMPQHQKRTSLAIPFSTLVCQFLEIFNLKFYFSHTLQVDTLNQFFKKTKHLGKACCYYLLT